jgi:hypothetical protein
MPQKCGGVHPIIQGDNNASHHCPLTLALGFSQTLATPAALHMTRILVAFVVCTLGLPTYVAITGGRESMGAALAFFLPFTVLGCLLLGLPTFRFFLARGWKHLWQFALGGAMLGSLCAIPFVQDGIPQALRWAGQFAAFGTAHAVVFWLIAFWRSAPSVAGRSTGTKP